MLADYEYTLIEKSPDEVEGFLRHGDFAGINVTIPYKKTVLPYCKELSGAAARFGSVNTIMRRADGLLYGDNTDYYGFLYMLRKSGAAVGGKKALILGSGGASATVRAVLEDFGAGKIVTISRTGENNYSNIENHANAQIIVNTTPVGMYPDNGGVPVSLDMFGGCEAVLDVIYNPAKTELLLTAEDRGIMRAGGLYMLAAQAKRAAELFLGADIADEKIDEITRVIERQSKNIALIGMPGCGKSTVGRRLAELTGREFFDIDEQIIRRAGVSIESIFKNSGEGAFRDLESEVLCDVAKKSGCVIATGGGIVKRERNKQALRQNSTTVFLDRGLSELPTTGRPLSLAHGVEALYRKRAPLYDSWSEYKINSRGGVYETAMAVKEVLML